MRRPRHGPELLWANSAVIHRKRCSALKGLQSRPLESLLSPPDVVRPRGCQSLEPRPKARLPLERAVRGITPDTPRRQGRAALNIPAQGVLPLDAAIFIPSGLTPSIDHFCGNGTGCSRDESWPSQDQFSQRQSLSAGVRQNGCPLPSANCLFGNFPPARLAIKRYEIHPNITHPRTTRLPP